MKLSGCDCPDCIARKTSELAAYALMLESACIEIKRLLDADNSGPAYALIKEAAKAAAARDLAGEIKAAAQERVIQDAAELDCTKQRFPAFPTLRDIGRACQPAQ